MGPSSRVSSRSMRPPVQVRYSMRARDPRRSPSPMEAREVLDSSRAGRRAIRGGALRVAGYVAGLLLGLISVPLLIRHLGVADFGHYVTVQSIFAIAVGLTEGGLVSVAVREYSTRSGADRERTMRNLLGMRLVL